MTKQEKGNGAQPEMKGGYPQTTLDQALKLGDAVKICGGASGPVPKAMIARTLGVSATALSTQVATAKTFGIVTGYTDLELTDAGRDYFHPTDAADKRRAELQFIFAPPAFAFLIKRFDGHQLPKPDALANILLRARIVPTSWTSRAAAFFKSSAIFLGIIDGAGFLRFEAEQHAAGIRSVERPATGATPMSHAGEAAPRTHGAVQPLAAAPIAGTHNVWVFAGGEGRIETPNHLSEDDWKQLKAYVDTVLKPREARKEG